MEKTIKIKINYVITPLSISTLKDSKSERKASTEFKEIKTLPELLQIVSELDSDIFISKEKPEDADLELNVYDGLTKTLMRQALINSINDSILDGFSNMDFPI